MNVKPTGAYHALRSTHVLTLLSDYERTLLDYSHWNKGDVGFHTTVSTQLIKEANIKDKKDKYVVFSFDEMKFKKI